MNSKIDLDAQSEAPAQRPASSEAPQRREYLPPRIELLGDVRDLTLGTTPGQGDSATDPLNFQT